MPQLSPGSLKREFIYSVFQPLTAAGVLWLVAASQCAVFMLPSVCVSVSKLPLYLPHKDICNCVEGLPGSSRKTPLRILNSVTSFAVRGTIQRLKGLGYRHIFWGTTIDSIKSDGDVIMIVSG